jgi:hypothetical protein
MLLDAEGHIFARTEKLGETDADFVAAVIRVLGPPQKLLCRSSMHRAMRIAYAGAELTNEAASCTARP